jgi:hypothetical protein
MNYRGRFFKFSFAFLLAITLSSAAFAAQPSIEQIGPIKAAVPEAVKAAVVDNGYRVSLDGAVLAEIWPAKEAISEKNGSGSAVYPDFAVGGFYGVITLPNGGGDFRGQKISAGTYTLRYELLPGDGNHMGVAPNPDFFLLVPVDADPGPGNKIPSAGLIKLSARASGTAHPAVFSLTSPADKSPDAAQDDQGFVVATFPMVTKSGVVAVGMIVKGSAEQ